MTKTEQLSWDLSAFGYTGVGDLNLIQDIHQYERYARAACMYLERIAQTTNQPAPGDFFAVQNALENIIDPPLMYATLTACADVREADTEKKIRDTIAPTKQAWRKAQETYVLTLPMNFLEENLSHQTKLKRLHKQATRNADENISTVLQKEAEIRKHQAAYKQEFGQLIIEHPETHIPMDINQAILVRREAPSVPLRKRVRHAMKNKLASYTRKAASHFDSILHDRLMIAQEKGIEPISGELEQEELTRKSYDALIQAARTYRTYLPVREIHTRLILKLPRPTGPDEFVVPPKENETPVLLNESKERIKRIWGTIDPAFAEIIESAFREKRIHIIGQMSEKRTAARSSVHGSFINIPWQGEKDNVRSLIHELGHFIHFSCKSQNNPLINHETPGILNETISRFSELLLANDEKNRQNTQKNIIEHLDDKLGKVYWYLALHDFELRCYDAIQNNASQTMTPRILTKLWKKSMRKWGLPKNGRHGNELNWIRMGHLFRTQLGVFRYLPPVLLAEKIFTQYEEARIAGTMPIFATKLKKMLSMGNDHTLSEIFQTLDINLEDPKIWEDGFSHMKDELMLLQENLL